MRIGYRRVSTVDQNTARQLADVSVDKVFEDHSSGKDRNRPQLTAAMDWCRDGDTLVVHSLDRLARNLRDLLDLVDQLTSKGVSVQFVKENLVFQGKGKDSPMNTLLLNLLGSFAQFERTLILERQREGIQIAKLAGRYKGGGRKLKGEDLAVLRGKVLAGVPKSRIARELGISRTSVYEYMKEVLPIQRDGSKGSG